jgi:hypothetical protein
MIIIGSALLLAPAALLLLWQAIVIAYHLLKLIVLLVAWCGCAAALVVAGCAWLVMKLVQGFMPKQEPEGITITITIMDDG